MKVIPFLALCLLVCLQSGRAANDPDSLRAIIAHSQDQQLKLKALLSLTDYLRLRKNDSTLFYAQQAQMLARQLSDHESALEAAASEGLYIHNTGNRPQAKLIFLKALQNARQWSVDNMIPVLQNNLAIVYNRLGQRDSAFYYWTEAEKGNEALGRHYENWRVYHGLGDIYWERQDLENAERYLQKSLEITAEKGHAVDYGYMLFQIADFYFSTDNFEKLA